MLSTLLTSKAYLNLGSTSLIGISKNNLSSVLLSYFFRKEQSYAIMRAAGSARIIHEKLLCAMGKPFRRKATSGVIGYLLTRPLIPSVPKRRTLINYSKISFVIEQRNRPLIRSDAGKSTRFPG